MKSKKSKKSQEEMIGFILIIILVSVIAVVFLFISLRKPVEMRNSNDIANFLCSSMIYTTKCQPSQEMYYDFKGLIKACRENKECLDGQEACSVLNETAIFLLDSGFSISQEAFYKAYDFKAYVGNGTEQDNIISLRKGNFTGSITGSEAMFISGENYHIKLRLYY